MKSRRLLAFLAAALVTAAFLAVMITNDLSVGQQLSGATVTDTSADALPASD